MPSLAAISKIELPFKINQEEAKVNNFVSILERESKIKRLKGTLGLNISKKDSLKK